MEVLDVHDDEERLVNVLFPPDLFECSIGDVVRTLQNEAHRLSETGARCLDVHEEARWLLANDSLRPNYAAGVTLTCGERLAGACGTDNDDVLVRCMVGQVLVQDGEDVLAHHGWLRREGNGGSADGRSHIARIQPILHQCT